MGRNLDLAFTKGELVEYYNRGLSLQSIAKIFGAKSHETIRYWFKKYGIPCRGNFRWM